jgi:hypothetical protein
MRFQFTETQEAGFRAPALIMGTVIVGLVFGEVAYFLETGTRYGSSSRYDARLYYVLFAGLGAWFAMASRDPWFKVAWAAASVGRLFSFLTALGAPGVVAWLGRGGLDMVMGLCLIVGSHTLEQNPSSLKWRTTR